MFDTIERKLSSNNSNTENINFNEADDTKSNLSCSFLKNQNPSEILSNFNSYKINVTSIKPHINNNINNSF